MKTILKFVITIAIIVGVVFGVKYFIDDKSKSGTDAVYSSIIADGILGKTLPSEYQKDLKDFLDYVNDNPSNLPLEIQTSINSGGKYEKMCFFYDIVRGYLVDLTSQSASLYKISKQDVKDLNNLQTKLLKSIEQAGKKFREASKLIKDCEKAEVEPAGLYLKNYFIECEAVHQDTLIALTDYTLKLSDIVKVGLFDGNAMNLKFELNRVQTKMIGLLFTKNGENNLRYDELLDSANILNSQIQVLKTKGITSFDYQTFILNYSACTEQDIVNLMVVVDKQAFVDATTNTNLEKVATYLFDITKTPAAPEPPLEPEQNVGEVD